MSRTDVIIVGAGLSGLTAATLLAETGRSVRVLEAAPRIGGRIHALRDAQGGYLADLGPSWIWPKFQPVAARWLNRLDVTTFPQFEMGNAIVEIAGHRPDRRPLPGQEGQMRLVGGPSILVERLAAGLPEESILVDTHVSRIEVGSNGASALTPEATFSASQCILALPPRIAVSTITFEPPLESSVVHAMEATPTWMAAQAKAVAVYDRPFWREAGLSGRIASQVGPMVEAHDLSGKEGTPAAIFGFVGYSAGDRESLDLDAMLRDQLTRCFGDEVHNPLALVVEDWAKNPLICSTRDRDGPMMHPQLAPAPLRAAQGHLHFAVAETASQSPGLIDGAFEAGERAARTILDA